MYKTNKYVNLTILLLLIAVTTGKSQDLGIKTNLLYDATATINLGMETRVDSLWTIDLSGNYNAWKLGSNKQIKHWLIQPEARYWLREAFGGHFFGFHLMGGQYNVANVKLLGTNGYRYQGWLMGAGISYGYAWRLDERWNLEASLGLGYARLAYDKYPCGECGARIKSSHTNYFGPTRASISIIYFLK